jgi:hypothetical protein
VKTNRIRSIPRKGPTERSPGGDAGPNALGSDAADLMPVVAALAKLNDGELCALIEVTNNVPQFVPGLLAWIGHACDWELHRRAFVDFPLQSPESAIPVEENSASIVAMIILRARFDQGAGRDACPVVALFDAMIRALTGGARRH